MKKNFEMAIVLGAAICGFAVQLSCQAQSAASRSNKDAVPQTASSTPPAQTDSVEMAALAGSESEPGAPAGGAAAPASSPAAATPGDEGTHCATRI
jgi:hypothetical protein